MRERGAVEAASWPEEAVSGWAREEEESDQKRRKRERVGDRTRVLATGWAREEEEGCIWTHKREELPEKKKKDWFELRSQEKVRERERREEEEEERLGFEEEWRVSEEK